MRPIDQIIASVEVGHSDLQMDSFITEASGGTQWGCYRQAVLEVRSRFYSLRRETLDALILDAEIKEIPNVRKGKDSDRLRVFKQNLELSEKIEQLHSLIRELARFYAQADALRDLLDADPKPEAQLEREFWVKKMTIAAAKDIESSGRISGETMSSLILLGQKGEESLASAARNVFPKHLREMFEPYRIPSIAGKVQRARELILNELKQLPGSARVFDRLATTADKILAPASDPQ